MITVMDYISSSYNDDSNSDSFTDIGMNEQQWWPRRREEHKHTI